MSVRKESIKLNQRLQFFDNDPETKNLPDEEFKILFPKKCINENNINILRYGFSSQS
jgi:hypothetical protein